VVSTDLTLRGGSFWLIEDLPKVLKMKEGIPGSFRALFSFRQKNQIRHNLSRTPLPFIERAFQSQRNTVPRILQGARQACWHGKDCNPACEDFTAAHYYNSRPRICDDLLQDYSNESYPDTTELDSDTVEGDLSLNFECSEKEWTPERTKAKTTRARS
jgi:hypothetical protein